MPAKSTFNMIVGIEKPTLVTPSDFQIVRTIDAFLISHDKSPTATVAATIFPAGLYKRHGTKGVYEEYPQIYEEIKTQCGNLCHADDPKARSERHLLPSS